MRRLSSILLMLAFCLPMLTPLLALGQAEDASLPACCRRNGKHHCAMGMAMRVSMADKTPRFSTLAEKCPYRAITFAPSAPSGAPAQAAIIDASFVSHPTGLAQTLARRRVAQERAHGKRGPPKVQNL